MFRNFRLTRWEAYTMNNETKQDLRGACRCDSCRFMSAAYKGNGKGLLWDLGDLEAGPLRDLEVRV